MKVYFTGSLHNHDITKDTYRRIISILSELGHKVRGDHILQADTHDIEKQTQEQLHEYYQKLKKWMAASEVVVAEVSYPSTLNIGHEVSLAFDLGKPIIALYQKGRPPGILQGIASEKLLLIEYELADLKQELEYGLDLASEQMDVRFNFFISPKIEQYLDAISRKRKLPRAVYLRQLIETDMKNNDEYDSE